MAGPDNNNNTIQNVGIGVTAKGLEAGAKSVQQAVRNVAKELSAAGENFNKQIKQAGVELKRLQTLQGLRGFEGKAMLGGFGDTQSIGRQIRAMAEIRAGFNKTGDAAGVLRARVNQLNTSFGEMARSGQRPNKQSLLNANNLEQTAAAYGRVTNSVTALRGRIALMGDEQRKAFEPMLKQIDQLEAKNQKLFGRTNQNSFKPQLAQMQNMAQLLGQQVTSTEKLIATDNRRIESLRAEGLQILNNSRLEREARLAASVRAAGTRANNLSLIGGTNYMRDADGANRLNRATTALVSTQARLNAELAKPAAQQNAKTLETLIAREKELIRLQGEAIRLQAQQNSGAGGKGGFFGGIGAGISRVTQGASEDGGGMFGAGALVGRVGAYAVAAGAIYGLVASIKDGISFAIQFEDALAAIRAISGATSTEMERLSQGILEVSRTSVNSVLELTKSATIIAQAGYGGSEIKEMLQAVANLSAASGATADESVETLTSALGAYQMSAEEATRVTDVLVNGLNASKLTIQQMQLGLQYLGNTAAENNITIEELTASMGTLADAGIKSGSTAATGMRQMLVDFMDPSEKLVSQLTKIGLTTSDIDVKVLGLSTVLTRLRDAGFEAYGTLETRASAAYTALSRNIDNTQELLDKTNQAGAAQAAAETRATSLAAKWQQMYNQLAALGSELGNNFIPLLKFLVDVLGAVLMSFTAVAGAITYPLRLLGLFSETIDENVVSMAQAQAGFEAAGYSAQEAADMAALMGDSLNDITTASNDTQAAIASVETEQASLRSETQKLIMRQDELVGANGNLNETTTGVAAAVSNLSSRFPGLRSEFDKTKGGIAGLIQALTALDRKAQQTLHNLAQTALAQAEMKRQASLNALGTNVMAFNRGNGGRGNGYTPRAQKEDPIGYMLDTRFRELLSENDVGAARQALGMLNDNPALRRKYNSLYGQLSSGLSSYTNATQDRDKWKEQRGVTGFALSPEGERLLGIINEETADSTRAASQGSARGQSRAQIQARLKSREAELDRIEADTKNNPYAASLIDEARMSVRAAGNRLAPDVEKPKKSGGGRSAAERAAAKRETEDKRREKELERIDGKIAKEEMEFRKEQYENAVEKFKNAGDTGDLDTLLDDIDTTLGKWLGAEAESAIQEIEAMNPTKAQRDAMLAAAGRKADELREGEISKLGDTLAGVIKAYIDTTTKAIERQYDEAMRFTERNVALAQGRLDGLNNPLNNGAVPEYLKTLKQNELDVATDRNNRASQGAGATRLKQYQDMLAKVQKDKAEVEDRLRDIGRLHPENNSDAIIVTGIRGSATRELRQLDDSLLKITDDIVKQQLELDKLAAGYAALNDVPHTFGDGLRMAAQAARVDLGQVNGLGQELINNLDQPLAALHEGFKGFFSDMLSGSVSVGQAFKNLAGTVIDAINQMVAVAIAKQFFSLILSAFGAPASGPVSGSVGGMTGATGSIFGLGGGWTGGQIGRDIPMARMYGGGSVRTGLGTRDSTIIHAAKDEYLIQRSAAQSIGRGMLNDINSRGAAALRDIATPQTPMMAPAPEVTSNIYIIAPEEKPQMGPNDVLATFSNDVLKGGVTRKLIKQVAHGR